MSDTKTKLQEIKEKATNSSVALTEIGNLFAEWWSLNESLTKDKTKKEERKLALETGETINTATFNYIDKWEKGEVEPKKEGLYFLSEWCQLLHAWKINLAAIEKAINKMEQFDAEEKQQNIKWLKKNAEKFKKYEPKLEILFSKEQEKFNQHEKENEDSNISSETSSEEKSQQSEEIIKNLNAKISLIQNQVEELKEKLNSADSTTKQEIQQKIEKLEELRKNVQAQLDKLQNEVSSRSSSTNSTNTDKRNKEEKKFPILGIILIIFAVLAIAGIVGYFILEKKEKPKPKKIKSK